MDSLPLIGRRIASDEKFIGGYDSCYQLLR